MNGSSKSELTHLQSSYTTCRWRASRMSCVLARSPYGNENQAGGWSTRKISIMTRGLWSRIDEQALESRLTNS